MSRKLAVCHLPRSHLHFQKRELAKVKQGTKDSNIGGIPGKDSRFTGKGLPMCTVERKYKQKFNFGLGKNVVYSRTIEGLWSHTGLTEFQGELRWRYYIKLWQKQVDVNKSEAIVIHLLQSETTAEVGRVWAYS